jgi:hypothetical protein
MIKALFSMSLIVVNLHHEGVSKKHRNQFGNKSLTELEKLPVYIGMHTNISLFMYHGILNVC